MTALHNVKYAIFKLIYILDKAIIVNDPRLSSIVNIFYKCVLCYSLLKYLTERVQL